MRVQNALAIATSDRSVQIQAKHTADAERILQDLYDAASAARSSDFPDEANADPESSAMALGWAAAGKQKNVPASQTSRREAAGLTPSSHAVSLWA